MRIIEVETIACAGLDPQFILVRLHTDEGLVGLGQTADFRTAPVVHDLAQRFVLGRDPRHLARITYDLFTFARYHGYAGAEGRALSAIDIALWDLLGKVTEQPVYQLLGDRYATASGSTTPAPPSTPTTTAPGSGGIRKGWPESCSTPGSPRSNTRRSTASWSLRWAPT